jgi:acyl carrier protein
MSKRRAHADSKEWRVAAFEEWTASVLELPVSAVNDELGPANCGSWTSLRQVQLVSAAQRRYGVRLTPRQVRSVRSIGDLRRVLELQGVQP